MNDSLTQNGAIAADGLFSGYPDLLTVDDMQSALGIGRSTAYRLINEGRVKNLRIGKVIKIPKRFLIDFVYGACYNELVVMADSCR